jgi:FLVCR family feline leukemia virus subgroup C receptor-related protein
MHWLQYSIIANIMMRYYSVSSLAINWTSMIYMACYIPFVFPASWLLDRKVCTHCTGTGIYTVMCDVFLMGRICMASHRPESDKQLTTFVVEDCYSVSQEIVMVHQGSLFNLFINPSTHSEVYSH